MLPNEIGGVPIDDFGYGKNSGMYGSLPVGALRSEHLKKYLRRFALIKIHGK